MLRRIPGHRDGTAVVFDRPREGQVVFEAIDWEHPRHGRFFATNRPYLAESNPLEDCLTEDPIQVMFTGSCAPMRGLFHDLQEEASGRFSVALTEYQRRDFSLVDVVRSGGSTGSALRVWARAKGYFVPSEDAAKDFAIVAPASPERVEADAAIECIGCGVCYAGCDVVAWRPDYLGPAALKRAWSLVNGVNRPSDSERRARRCGGNARSDPAGAAVR